MLAYKFETSSDDDEFATAMFLDDIVAGNVSEIEIDLTQFTRTTDPIIIELFPSNTFDHFYVYVPNDLDDENLYFVKR